MRTVAFVKGCAKVYKKPLVSKIRVEEENKGAHNLGEKCVHSRLCLLPFGRMVPFPLFFTRGALTHQML